MRRLTLAAFALLVATAACTPSPAPLAQRISAAAPFPDRALAWRGEERWRLAVDGEAGTLRLGFTQTPAGDYLLSGALQLDDAELGVTGTGRWRAGRLILDLAFVGGVRDVAPDPGKQRLYAPGAAPATVNAVGFAMMRAELDGTTLAGRTAQYQTNVVTGDKLQGPILRLGALEHLP
ncbi:MAG: hypothetical protein PW843_27135 [Azospirillaceae bacterium]|nr:hypothetical protein [Azospirillaceae bacterium]